MERLTYDFAAYSQHCWQVKGADNALCEEVCRDQGYSGCKHCPIAKAFDRLAAYEDTGLEPEEIKNWMLTQGLIDSGITPAIIGTPLKHLFYLAKAEAEGHLVILPCKVGDVVFYIRGQHIISGDVKRVVLDGISGQVIVDANHCYLFSDFGKTVFLTCEKTEAALKGARDDA